MRHLIIGNGVAGTSAAARIRHYDPGAVITILSEEAHPFYSRIRLTDYLAGKLQEQDLILRDQAWYEDRGIDLQLNRRVTRIEPAAKRVETEFGTTLLYDRLLLAAGGAAIVPSLPGVTKKGVFTLRSLQDAQAIRHHAAQAGRVLLIGGGVLGLETGNALRLAGCEVLIVEYVDRLLPNQMDQAGSRLLQRQLTDKGLRFELGVKVAALTGGGRISGFVLEDGRSFSCDLAIIAAGMQPRKELMGALGQPVRRGVVVDDHLRTRVPDVFAAGDQAEHREVVYGVWGAAQKQGEVAGANMAGRAIRFTGMVPSKVLKVAEIQLAALGDIDPQGRREAIIEQNPERYLYRKLVLSGNRLVGAIFYGDLRVRRLVAEAIDQGLEITDSVKKELARGNMQVLAEAMRPHPQ